MTVLPSGRTSRVREILSFDGALPRAELHDAITLVLDDAIDVSRGDMIVLTSAPSPTCSALDATICWLGDDPLDVRRRYVVRHTTREVKGVIAAIDQRWDPSSQTNERAPATLRTNDIGRVRVRLTQPLAVDPYGVNRATGSFILVDETSNNTVAAGMIQ